MIMNVNDGLVDSKHGKLTADGFLSFHVSLMFGSQEKLKVFSRVAHNNTFSEK